MEDLMYFVLYAAKLEAAYCKLEELKGLIALESREYYGYHPEEYNNLCRLVLKQHIVSLDDMPEPDFDFIPAYNKAGDYRPDYLDSNRNYLDRFHFL